MKHIKQDFSLKAWVKSPAVDLGVGPRSLIFFGGHVAYQIKADDACSNMVAQILPTDTNQGWGHTIYLKVVMLHTKLKGIEHRAP